jgi:chemotaxis protein MotB
LKKTAWNAPTRRLLLLAGLPTLLGSCVTTKRYNELQAREQTTAQARDAAEKQVRLTKAELQKANNALAEQRLTQQRLAEDSTLAGQTLRGTRARNAKLQDSYDQLQKNSDRALADRNADYGKLAKDLATREAELGALDVSLRKTKADNDRLAADLTTREARLTELTQALADKDRAVNELRTRVSQALLAFNGKDLQVRLKDGKVYVSLSEQLLFKSGSTQVDPKGQEALKKLAAVLQEQPDVNVLVEGHTDNVPIKGVVNGARDNWDLSALRATEIARLLATGGVEPSRITAAGRSQFLPVAANDSAPNKALNRRTEIILTPKLDQLFQLLDNGGSGATPAGPGK